MSWEAVTWASKQKMKLPHEQLILLVLANCADPGGVAFAQWPGKEHWWRYLVDHTRLSKSSLFRHINTLINLKICTREITVLADGSRRPVVHLDLSASFDIEHDQDKYDALHSHQRDQSHGETENEEGSDRSENANETSRLHPEIIAPSLQSHGETGPTHGNENDDAIPTHGNGPFPIVGMQRDSNLDSNYSPLPPSGGESASDELWEQFVRSWGEIPKMTLTRTAWNRIPTTKRAEVVASSKGYWAFRRAQSKPPTPPSAQSFLRDSAGWAQWLRYVPGGDGSAPSITLVFSRSSPEGRAIEMLYEIAGASEAFHKINLRSDGSVSYRRPITPRLLALANAPPKDTWVRLDYQQAAAWENKLLREAVTVQVRHRLHEGSRAPWLWPPNIDGRADPPLAGLSDQELADFK